MNAYEKEIIELHSFFEHWLGGTLEHSREAFDPLELALAEGFHIIGPDGNMTARTPLIANLYKAHGKRQGLTIWIKNVQLHYEDKYSLTASYEEWQRFGESETARLSTVLFLKQERLRWQHVHETYLTR